MGDKELRCSFCGKSQEAVERLISSPNGGAYICSGCVGVCAKILEDDQNAERSEPDDRPPTHVPLWIVRMFGGGN